ncbi:hypothetical protein NDU88_004169 [Pleurodeles waltl]|uniref:Uncharacterized protein n=1 Tax=Pleurodeles waltl TaxID=8319 RepID=A0AAV7T8Z5_PLEWA|nr:hypothetical protein NDU88_004169 [Pleurodeles waltl]
MDPQAALWTCDGPALFGPSLNASCTVAARSTPELVDRAANPLGLPVSEGQPQRNRVPEETEKGKWTDGGEEEKSGRSKTATEQRRQPKRQLKRSKDADRGGNPKESAWGYRQHRPRCRRRTAKLPATLQEKRGILRCVQKSG